MRVSHATFARCVLLSLKLKIHSDLTDLRPGGSSTSSRTSLSTSAVHGAAISLSPTGFPPFSISAERTHIPHDWRRLRLHEQPPATPRDRAVAHRPRLERRDTPAVSRSSHARCIRSAHLSGRSGGYDGSQTTMRGTLRRRGGVRSAATSRSGVEGRGVEVVRGW
ncbi:hypothetical protein EDB86DRAFT_594884 [Lactarius hatsudake]|nr:hypothetical protein EDB86DRAFT_594884 [Lactarius hatsudake]